jgi:hypothetical protein
VNYAGPDTNGTTVNGTCTDKAGNRAGGTSPSFKYDSTPPTLSNVGFDWDDGTATLTWSASPDTKEIEIDRTPGTAGPDPSAVFKGLASSFEDRGLKNKVKYVYTISLFDDAGNKATDTVSIIPGAKLYSPARGTTLKSPPLLAWRPVAGAAYYNVQLYYGVGATMRLLSSVGVSGRKVMSVWPLQPRYRLKKAWKFKGKARKLAADREQVRPAHRSERLLHREALAGQFASTGPALFWPLVPPTPPEASAATTRTSHATRQRINSRIDAFDAVAASEFASRSP